MKTRAAVAFQAKKPLEIVELDLEGLRRVDRVQDVLPSPRDAGGDDAPPSSAGDTIAPSP